MADTPHSDPAANEQGEQTTDTPTNSDEQTPMEDQLTEDLSVQGGE